MAYTAILKLNRAWLTPVDNLASSLVVGTTRTSPTSASIDAFVRQYASGRRQSVTTSLKGARVAPMTLVAINSASIDWLYANQAKTILYRSRAGERMFGQYFSFTFRPLDHVTLGANALALPGSVANLAYDVDLELNEVDYLEVAGSG